MTRKPDFYLLSLRAAACVTTFISGIDDPYDGIADIDVDTYEYLEVLRFGFVVVTNVASRTIFRSLLNYTRSGNG